MLKTINKTNLLKHAITGAFAAGGGLSFFSDFSGSVLLSTTVGAATAEAARAGGREVAGFVSVFAAVGAIPFSATYTC